MEEDVGIWNVVVGDELVVLTRQKRRLQRRIVPPGRLAPFVDLIHDPVVISGLPPLKAMVARPCPHPGSLLQRYIIRALQIVEAILQAPFGTPLMPMEICGAAAPRNGQGSDRCLGLLPHAALKEVPRAPTESWAEGEHLLLRERGQVVPRVGVHVVERKRTVVGRRCEAVMLQGIHPFWSHVRLRNSVELLEDALQHRVIVFREGHHHRERNVPTIPLVELLDVDGTRDPVAAIAVHAVPRALLDRVEVHERHGVIRVHAAGEVEVHDDVKERVPRVRLARLDLGHRPDQHRKAKPVLVPPNPAWPVIYRPVHPRALYLWPLVKEVLPQGLEVWPPLLIDHAHHVAVPPLGVPLELHPRQAVRDAVPRRLHGREVEEAVLRVWEQ
mmetsp:Transcript_9433/g.27717  ORF Transcript_9433/g.27717 Transcript_9433/m.27717 type:complete len:386 (-) Transcript_9433:644-1801(-)